MRALSLLALPLLALVAGSLVYCVLTIIAAVRYRAVQPAPLRTPPPISVLKPLAGVDDGLEENLRSFFEQQYGCFEILFAVRSPEDPAIAVAERLRAAYPGIPSRLIITGEPPYANAKVYSLDRMLAAASHDLLVMSDSDICVTSSMLSTIAAEFQDPRLGLATCPYRAQPGRSFWSTLEAVGLNTEFIGGVLVARMLDGMKFALGPTIAARRETLARIGGFDAVKDYLAEDFVMGKLAAEHGYGVILSSYVIEHRIGGQAFAANLKHRLRWNRSTRRSRPWGYIGQVFTNPLPLALLLWAVSPSWWPLVAATAIFRAAAGWATAGHALRDPLVRRLWWLVPLQDVASFVVWIGGFFGNTILWRGRKYYLLPDGRFELVTRGGADAVVLFDGVCNMCNGSVRFIIARDPGAHFRFAALDSEAARRMLDESAVSGPLPDSIALIENRRVYTRSAAALRIARKLRFPWPLISALTVVPRPLRDMVYDLIARNRYRWFGKRESCMVPTAELRKRFIA